MVFVEVKEGGSPGKSSDKKYVKITRTYEDRVVGEPYITAEFACLKYGKLPPFVYLPLLAFKEKFAGSFLHSGQPSLSLY